MARPLRIEYAGAIYHVMTRGNGRQLLFHGQDDYQRMLHGLEKTVWRTGWEVFSFVWMVNHIHLFFRTPRPNLSKGMQYLLSGYANWYAKRHQRTGHLFQGRFKGELIEDESYFWNVSRYVHLNPVRGKRPLVQHPRDWPWSSYPGYARERARLDWMAYESYRQRRGTAAGRDLAAYLAHRRTTATLRELADLFGLRHPDSVSNLIRRAERALADSAKLKKTVVVIDRAIATTRNSG